MFPSFELFGKTFGMYGLMAMVGFVVCGLVAFLIGRSRKIAFEDIILVILSIGAGLMVGGHLLYGITRMSDFFTFIGESKSLSFVDVFNALLDTFGGSVFYGGFLGGLCAILIHTKFSKDVKRSQILDVYAVSVPLFHMFGRLGCFFGGCCYGIEHEFGFVAPENPLLPGYGGVSRFPVQLIEAGCNLLIFVVILLLYLKRKKEYPLLPIYLLIYPPVRFTLEFFRGDAIRGHLFGLSTSQWISIFLFAAAIIWLVLRKRNLKNAPESASEEIRTETSPN